MSDVHGVRIHVTGIVQGVGFRPFVYSLAQELSITGWVRNTSAGVDIELDGPGDRLESFVKALSDQAPPLARIDTITSEEITPNGFPEFSILRSQVQEGEFQPISPDVSICMDCARELYDPEDRRFRYPFINCTNCGPRFTIIKDTPYDRPKTTMAPFSMCSDCSAEYKNPLDRRFHAQPIACPVCGPKIWYEVGGEKVSEADDALRAARRDIAYGAVVAVKGLGGFHLVCDATNNAVVEELRERKLRVDKAFAVMMPDIETIEQHCYVSVEERSLISSRERPIVILQRRENSTIASVAPGQRTLGVMLPYTPLHMLLLDPEDWYPQALVMTSGNISEEPIATDNQEARKRLNPLVDAFLLHDRDIETRCDDSVNRIFDHKPYQLRRSRGFAPNPILLAWEGPPTLAAGTELKNTFCLTRDRYAFVSHHIGDLENYETLKAFEDGIAHLERLFKISPELIAYDLHPNYMATRYALERSESEGIRAIGIQHHHAHIVACMAEHGIDRSETVAGIAFDGAGYGDDGAIWGGEFLVSNYSSYERAYHLKYIPLPGVDQAVKEPWRMAISWLQELGLDHEEIPSIQQRVGDERIRIVQRQLEIGLNAPLTSSVGRLFDAVASLVGIRQMVNYEAQAAIELEAIVDPDEGGIYPFEVSDKMIDPSPVIRSIIEDIHRAVPVSKIAARFHNSISTMLLDICLDMRERFGTSTVVLSGGVWQNMVLLAKTVAILRGSGLEVVHHRKVPSNDGGVSLGQAAIAQCIADEVN